MPKPLRIVVEFQNAVGRLEKRKLNPGAAIDLFDRFDRQGRRVLAVHAACGEVWTVAEARRQFDVAVGENYKAVA